MPPHMSLASVLETKPPAGEVLLIQKLKRSEESPWHDTITNT
jgi:hypothetical protein